MASRLRRWSWLLVALLLAVPQAASALEPGAGANPAGAAEPAGGGPVASSADHRLPENRVWGNFSSRPSGIRQAPPNAGTSPGKVGFEYGEGVRSTCSDKELDEEIGLVYFGARYYWPQLGRWVSADPLYAGNPESGLGAPRELNTFGFVSGNPYRFVDPDGLQTVYEFRAAETLGNPQRYELPSELALPLASAMAGSVPVAGEIADVAELSYSVATGDVEGAAASAVGLAIPLLGARVLKWGVKAAKGWLGLGADAAEMATDVAKSQLAKNKLAGDVGEAAADIEKNTRRIPSASGKKAYRIPDEMDEAERTIGEVKNVNYQAYTSQLKDDVAHVTRGGGQGQVNVTVDRRTTVSKPLQQASDDPDSPINVVRKNLNP